MDRVPPVPHVKPRLRLYTAHVSQTMLISLRYIAFGPDKSM